MLNHSALGSWLAIQVTEHVGVVSQTVIGAYHGGTVLVYGHCREGCAAVLTTFCFSKGLKLLFMHITG